jgi:hypothetical protein
MEQFFKNENTRDVFMNEIKIEDELLLELEEMRSLQTKGSTDPKKKENNLKKLQVQTIFWSRNSRNALCWAFYCVNDNKKINVIALQTMHYIFCHNNPILNVNPKI